MKLLPISLLSLGTLLAAGAAGYAFWGKDSTVLRKWAGESLASAATIAGTSSAVLPPWKGLIGTWHNEYKVAFQPGKEVNWDTTITYDHNSEYRAVARINNTVIRHSGSFRVEGDQIKYVRKTCNIEGGSTDMSRMCSSNDSPSARFALNGDALEISSDQATGTQKFERVASK
ncbi:MAG TPA: hypothetical protein VIV60_21070 [Polyangiaceae bacterium]